LRGFLNLKTSKSSSKGNLSTLLLFLLLIQAFTVKADVFSTLSDSLKTKHLWLASQVLPGSGQIINKQYWKIPVFYAGMGSMLYLASDANKTYKSYKTDYLNLDPTSLDKEVFKERYTKMKQTRNIYYAGASAFYLASVVDALLVYNNEKHSPAAATIFSTIIPGMGQVYNKKYWKVPIVYGGLSTMIFLVDWNNRGYKRFKTAIKQFPNDEFDGARSTDELQIYENAYRRNRDISFVALMGVYVLNIIDANVDANLYDWNIDDDLSLRIEPSIINNNFASISSETPAFGLTCRFNF
jgi:hypothetical protein